MNPHTHRALRAPLSSWLLLPMLVLAAALLAACFGEEEEPGNGAPDVVDSDTDDTVDQTCSPGATRPADDGCNTCTCGADGTWACTLMGCVPQAECADDSACAPGETCNASDLCLQNPGCPACDDCWGLCVAGTPGACTEQECGPRLGMPNTLCDDGVTVAGPGACVRGANGTCGWEIVQCPQRIGCHGDDACPTGMSCNAAEVCLSDPACPMCAVCFGWCVAADPNACSPGETRQADDGCNTCTCVADGQWACTEMACVDGDALLCAETGGRWDPSSCGHYLCGDFPACDAVIPGCDCGPGRTFVAGAGCQTDASCPAVECVTDEDCQVGGCSGQLCAAEALASTCEWLEEYACYQDASVTTCGCNAGRCGWDPTAELQACLQAARP